MNKEINKEIEKMLSQNNFDEIANEFKEPDNQYTCTRVLIDLKIGECWIDVLCGDEWKVYEGTVIVLMTQRKVAKQNRNADFIRKFAKQNLEMYLIDKIDHGMIESINFHELEEIKWKRK